MVRVRDLPFVTCASSILCRIQGHKHVGWCCKNLLFLEKNLFSLCPYRSISSAKKNGTRLHSQCSWDRLKLISWVVHKKETWKRLSKLYWFYGNLYCHFIGSSCIRRCRKYIQVPNSKAFSLFSKALTLQIGIVSHVWRSLTLSDTPLTHVGTMSIDFDF